MVGYGDAVYVVTPLFLEGWWLNTSRNIRALFCHNHGSILGKFPAPWVHNDDLQHLLYDGVGDLLISSCALMLALDHP